MGSTGSQSASPSTCVQKLARQKFRVSSYETIEKNSFLELTPKPEAVATDSMGDL